MFYEKQPESEKQNYKAMLETIGSLTNLFSESSCPYLPYRAHENTFCKYFHAENLGRLDCSADAKKNGVGIGLKTWTGQDDQKVAEFGKLRDTYKGLEGMELVKKIAGYRNERIKVTKNMHGIREMYYHVIRRVPGYMQVLECLFEYIDVDRIVLLKNKGNVNNTYFTDGKHTYHFSTSKNTLYMIFDDMDLLDQFPVNILDDPFDFLMNAGGKTALVSPKAEEETPAVPSFDSSKQLCLRLYSESKSKGKFVPDKSGLNQWNAGGRARHPDELYIPYQAVDRDRIPGFFPPRDTNFVLYLPDGTEMSAKVCQEAGKAIMSNPNKALGKWLLRDVFELKPGTIVTYEMLSVFGIDSVIFTKQSDLHYSVDFAPLGTYDLIYNSGSSEDEEDSDE